MSLSSSDWIIRKPNFWHIVVTGTGGQRIAKRSRSLRIAGCQTLNLLSLKVREPTGSVEEEVDLHGLGAVVGYFEGVVGMV